MSSNELTLIIRLQDGEPFEHPIHIDNFTQIFPEIDVNNLPPEFAKFERVRAPSLGVYEKINNVSYELGPDGIYRDTYTVVSMSGTEIQEKQNDVISYWNDDPYTPKSWIFDEDICSFVPPVPYPTEDGKNYYWDESSTSWKTE